MDVDDNQQFDGSKHILDTVDGEICFFRALMRARPIGMHRHFHVISMQTTIEKGVKQPVSIEDILQKLDECYNMEQLDVLEAEYEAAPSSSSSSSQQPPSPSPDQNLSLHPFFRSEFQLPQDPFINDLIITRRTRHTASLPSSPAPAAPEPSRPRRGRKRKPSKADISKAEIAGLVSGDSDSSALTVESGDDVDANGQTPSERRGASVATGTEAETDELHDEDTAEADTATSTRKRGPYNKRGRGGRVRGAKRRKKQ